MVAPENKNENNKKQMKLKNFCETYDIPRTTVLKWVQSNDFPAYNLCGHWYVDISKFYKWREMVALNNKIL